jgi:hypothetical protein
MSINEGVDSHNYLPLHCSAVNDPPGKKTNAGIDWRAWQCYEFRNPVAEVRQAEAKYGGDSWGEAVCFRSLSGRDRANAPGIACSASVRMHNNSCALPGLGVGEWTHNTRDCQTGARSGFYVKRG